MTTPPLNMKAVGKTFVLHLQHHTPLQVLHNFDLQVNAGECVRLSGRSGLGKSTVLKLAYGNYRCSEGDIWITANDGTLVNMATASAQQTLQLRASTLGYVSQFLRVIPRVSALDLIAQPLLEPGLSTTCSVEQAQDLASQWLVRLRIPKNLWQLPPATFSGGEQQRINIARSLIRPWPVLLLDEPTASLDPLNTRTVIELILEARQRGSAILGIFHDNDVAQAVSNRSVAMPDREAPT